MKKVKVDLSWKVWSLLVGFFVLIGAIGVSYAYGSANPTTMGHSLSEIGIPACLEGQSLSYDSQGNLACKSSQDEYNCHWEKTTTNQNYCNTGACQFKTAAIYCFPTDSSCEDNGYISSCGTKLDVAYLYCC